MGRKASVRYWPGRKGGGYFCVYKAKRYELALGPDDAPAGPTYLAALETFKELMQGAVPQAKPTSAQGSGPTIREVLDAYLKHVSKTKKPGTLEVRLRSFTPFVNYRTRPTAAALGEKPVSDLTHQAVYDFMEAMETPRTQERKKEQKGRKAVGWGPGSQRNFLQGVTAAFNWAVTGKMIGENPLARIEKPGANSRGADALLGTTAEEIEATHARILKVCRRHWHPYIQALKDTGARPGELSAATAADFDEKLGAIVFRKEMSRRSDRFSHKTSKYRDRVIMLPEPTLSAVKELVKRHPTGPLFRRVNGKGFGKVTVVDRFRKLRVGLKLEGLTAYSYRHTWATEMLKAGMDVDTLATLMGNSAAVVRQHYSHLLADTKALREKLERFRSAAGR